MNEADDDQGSHRLAAGATVVPAAEFGPEPLVSVGLPTRNGARHLADALTCLIGQTYRNLEILVSDNNSADDTTAIATAFADRDPRVKVVRQPEYLIAAANFDFVLRQTSGPLFMWAGDDDRWEPGYVEACVAALQAFPRAPMACTRLDFIGDDIDPAYALDYEHFDNPDLSSPDVRIRVRELMSRHGWYQIYGLFRREPLEALGSQAAAYGADVVLTLRVILEAPIVRVDEVLFRYRVYRARTGERSPFEGLADRVKAAPYSHLEETCSRAIWAAPIGRLARLCAWIGMIEATCLRPTSLRTRIRGEVATRFRMAVTDRDLRSIAKYGPLRAMNIAINRTLAIVGRRRTV